MTWKIKISMIQVAKSMVMLCNINNIMFEDSGYPKKQTE